MDGARGLADDDPRQLTACQGRGTVSRVILFGVADVSIRDLRNHGGDVVDRVERGETVVITRAGKPVAELRPLRKKRLSAEELLERCRRLPHVDPRQLREDVDAVVDASPW